MAIWLLQRCDLDVTARRLSSGRRTGVTRRVAARFTSRTRIWKSTSGYIQVRNTRVCACELLLRKFIVVYTLQREALWANCWWVIYLLDIPTGVKRLWATVDNKRRYDVIKIKSPRLSTIYICMLLWRCYQTQNMRIILKDHNAFIL